MEVCLSQKEANRRNLVESVFDWECIFGTQQGEEVVGPEIVSNKVECSHPNISLEAVALMPRDVSFNWSRPNDRNYDAWNTNRQTNQSKSQITHVLFFNIQENEN